jgi:spermidine synthase
MRVSRPDEPVLDYIRQMMGWLLFLEPPARIVQLGLGAGALTRYCLRRCPDAEVVVIERSAEVIETAHQWFALPRQHPRLSLHRTDALRFLETTKAPCGVLQVDLYDMHARGPAIESVAFYEACCAAVEAPGIAVFNLFGEHTSTDRNLRRLGRAFGGRILMLPVNAAGNLVVLAFKGPPLVVDWDTVAERAEHLRTVYRLPAHDWVRQMKRASGEARLKV